MYVKYTARVLRFFISCNFIDFSPFYSALGIIFEVPKRYLYFWGIWSPFIGE